MEESLWIRSGVFTLPCKTFQAKNFPFLNYLVQSFCIRSCVGVLHAKVIHKLQFNPSSVEGPVFAAGISCSKSLTLIMVNQEEES